MLSQERISTVDKLIDTAGMKEKLQMVYIADEVCAILENAGIYVYDQELKQVCAYIRIRLSE